MSKRKVKKTWRKIGKCRPVSEHELKMLGKWTKYYFRSEFKRKLFPSLLGFKETNHYYIPVLSPYILSDNLVPKTPLENRNELEDFKAALTESMIKAFSLPVEILKGEYNDK